MVSDKIIHKLNQISDYADVGCRCTKAQETGEDPTVCPMCTAGGLYNSICEEIENAHRTVFPIVT